MPWWLIALGAYLFLKKGSASPSPAGALPPAAAGPTVPAADYNAVRQGYDALMKEYSRLQAQVAEMQRRCPGAVTGPVTQAQVVDTTAKTSSGTVAGFDLGSRAAPRKPRTRPAKVINFPSVQDVMDAPDDDLDADERDDE